MRRARFVPPVVVIVLLAIIAMTAAAPASADVATAGRRPRRPRVIVSPRAVMVDQPFRTIVRGVPPKGLVELRVTLNAGGYVWSSDATFRSDRRGRIDVARDAPVSGDYQGVEPMGLIWSARLAGTAPVPPDHIPWTDTARISAYVEGKEVATTPLTRFYLRPGGRSVNVRAHGLVGTYFAPPGRGRHPAVLVFGGSEGGKTYPELTAAMLASHGYAALALAYFDPTGALPGIPRNLSAIPLEYFRTAIRWLGHRPSVDSTRVGVWGASRGGELALLLGTRNHSLHAVVANAPSSVVWSGLPDFTRAAWTSRGRPVPFLIPKVGDGPTGYDWYLNALRDPHANPAATIPVEKIDGPVLLDNGADDQLWPSQPMTEMIMARLRAHHHRYRDVHLSFPGTGHVIPLPNVPVTLVVGPGIGGNARDTAHSGVEAWYRTLKFLHRALDERHRRRVA
ncbi:MAG: hypothetical protein QOI55_1568 [Actinomycetota bacterium]|nr:hypothetical protein [Actinomycetota bacterium]